MASLPAKATHRQTRVFNEQLVLRAIYDRTEVSRAELARVTGLTRTTVSAIVGDLLREGLVEEAGRGKSTGGKAPILLRLRPHGRHLVGLDLGESTFSGAVVDLRGNVLRTLTRPIGGQNGRAAIELVFEMIDDLTSSNGAAPLLGVGIGAPGLIDGQSGAVRWSANLDWTDLPLGDLVEERFHVPVVVANDSQAAAVAELMFGNPPRPANLIVVRVGRGVGAGVILNGRLFQGDSSGAGEIGHAIFDVENGQLCSCGRTGCLETVASMRAMVSAARAVEPSVRNEKSLIDAFRSGDPAVCSVVLRAARALGMAIGAMIGALNVNTVLLIGPATELGPDWLAAVRQQAADSALPQLSRDTRIDLGTSRSNDVLIGASALLMTQELGLRSVR
jgi:predicted NBD/HSP70 family sugar kinase